MSVITITLPDGTTKTLETTTAESHDIPVAKNQEHVPEMWSNCQISYKGFSASLRSRKFNNQKRVEILYNEVWITLETADEPDISALIVDFYNKNIGVKP